jgi:hypothetical protein
VHRVPNPEYPLVEKYAPEKLATEPWYLYQLTPVGLEWREKLKQEPILFGKLGDRRRG